jgi:hypothetical protein
MRTEADHSSEKISNPVAPLNHGGDGKRGDERPKQAWKVGRRAAGPHTSTVHQQGQPIPPGERQRKDVERNNWPFDNPRSHDDGLRRLTFEFTGLARLYAQDPVE